SLLAIQLLHDMRQRHSLAFSLLDLMRRPTIGALAASLEGADENRHGRGDALLLRDAARNGESEQLADAMIKRLARISSDILEIPARELSVDHEFSEVELTRLLPHFAIAMKDELDFTLYPQDVFGTKSIDALARHIVDEKEGLARSRAPTRAERELLEQKIAESFEHASRVQDRRMEASAGGREEADASARPLVFVLSSGRSGSTLFRVMLAGHPDLFCPPELHLLMFETMAQRARELTSGHFAMGLDRALLELRKTGAAVNENRPVDLPGGEGDLTTRDVFLRLRDLVHPRILVDKSPPYTDSPETLRRAEAYFENAKYIHLHRHPYAAMESYVRNRFRALSGRGDIHPWLLAEHHWTTNNHNVLQFLETVPSGRKHTLSFEDLVTEPEMSMRHVCDFLHIPYTDSLLKPYDGGRMADGPGDPNFHRRDRIDPAMAEAWKEAALPSPLTTPSIHIAKQLGYETPPRHGKKERLSWRSAN
ncbi:MAG: hypothetical protein GY859_37745, partial [Desulfobacterales bacterium]|nr:hypothetical protein [Desulfobacterales bacterium]